MVYGWVKINKKSQISIAILIGILLIIGVGMFALFSNKNILQTLKFRGAEFSASIDNTKTIVESCLEETTLNAIDKYGILDSEKYIALYIDNNILACLDNFRALRDSGFLVEYNEPNSSVSINEYSISVDLNFPVTVKKGSELLNINEFSYSVKTVISQMLQSGKLKAGTAIFTPDNDFILSAEQDTLVTDANGNPLRSITVKMLDNNFDNLENDVVLGQIVYEGTPSQITFDPPLKVTLRLSKRDLPKEYDKDAPVLGWYSKDSDLWISYPDNEFRQDSYYYYYSASVSHFTPIALVACGNTFTDLIRIPMYKVFEQPITPVNEQYDPSKYDYDPFYRPNKVKQIQDYDTFPSFKDEWQDGYHIIPELMKVAECNITSNREDEEYKEYNLVKDMKIPEGKEDKICQMGSTAKLNNPDNEFTLLRDWDKDDNPAYIFTNKDYNQSKIHVYAESGKEIISEKTELNENKELIKKIGGRSEQASLSLLRENCYNKCVSQVKADLIYYFNNIITRNTPATAGIVQLPEELRFNPIPYISGDGINDAADLKCVFLDNNYIADPRAQKCVLDLDNNNLAAREESGKINLPKFTPTDNSPPKVDKLKIVLFGDSTTVGMGLCNSPNPLSRELGIGTQLIISGLKGESAAQSLSRYEKVINEKPAIALMWHGNYDPDDTSSYKDSYRRIINYLIAKKIIPVILTPIPSCVDGKLVSHQKLIGAANQLASEFKGNVHVIDVSSAVSAKITENCEKYYAADGILPRCFKGGDDIYNIAAGEINQGLNYINTEECISAECDSRFKEIELYSMDVGPANGDASKLSLYSLSQEGSATEVDASNTFVKLHLGVYATPMTWGYGKSVDTKEDDIGHVSGKGYFIFELKDKGNSCFKANVFSENLAKGIEPKLMTLSDTPKFIGSLSVMDIYDNTGKVCSPGDECDWTLNTNEDYAKFSDLIGDPPSSNPRELHSGYNIISVTIKNNEKDNNVEASASALLELKGRGLKKLEWCGTTLDDRLNYLRGCGNLQKEPDKTTERGKEISCIKYFVDENYKKMKISTTNLRKTTDVCDVDYSTVMGDNNENDYCEQYNIGAEGKSNGGFCIGKRIICPDIITSNDLTTSKSLSYNDGTTQVFSGTLKTDLACWCGDVLVDGKVMKGNNKLYCCQNGLMKEDGTFIVKNPIDTFISSIDVKRSCREPSELHTAKVYGADFTPKLDGKCPKDYVSNHVFYDGKCFYCNIGDQKCDACNKWIINDPVNEEIWGSDCSCRQSDEGTIFSMDNGDCIECKENSGSYQWMPCNAGTCPGKPIIAYAKDNQISLIDKGDHDAIFSFNNNYQCDCCVDGRWINFEESTQDLMSMQECERDCRNINPDPAKASLQNGCQKIPQEILDKNPILFMSTDKKSENAYIFNYYENTGYSRNCYCCKDNNWELIDNPDLRLCDSFCNSFRENKCPEGYPPDPFDAKSIGIENNKEFLSLIKNINPSLNQASGQEFCVKYGDSVDKIHITANSPDKTILCNQINKAWGDCTDPQRVDISCEMGKISRKKVCYCTDKFIDVNKDNSCCNSGELSTWNEQDKNCYRSCDRQSSWINKESCMCGSEPLVMTDKINCCTTDNMPGSWDGSKCNVVINPLTVSLVNGQCEYKTTCEGFRDSDSCRVHFSNLIDKLAKGFTDVSSPFGPSATATRNIESFGVIKNSCWINHNPTAVGKCSVSLAFTRHESENCIYSCACSDCSSLECRNSCKAYADGVIDTSAIMYEYDDTYFELARKTEADGKCLVDVTIKNPVMANDDYAKIGELCIPIDEGPLIPKNSITTGRKTCDENLACMDIIDTNSCDSPNDLNGNDDINRCRCVRKEYDPSKPNEAKDIRNKVNWGVSENLFGGFCATDAWCDLSSIAGSLELRCMDVAAGDFCQYNFGDLERGDCKCIYVNPGNRYDYSQWIVPKNKEGEWCSIKPDKWCEEGLVCRQDKYGSVSISPVACMDASAGYCHCIRQ